MDLLGKTVADPHAIPGIARFLPSPNITLPKWHESCFSHRIITFATTVTAKPVPRDRSIRLRASLNRDKRIG